MRTWVTLDFETASAVDLLKAGSWRYAEDPTTEILWLSWGERDKPHVTDWHPFYLPEARDDLVALALDPEVLFVAHNNQFEKAIWRCIMVPVLGFPDIPNDRWHCTMAVCANKSLPLQLERAAQVMGLRHQKDMEGNRLTKSLSKPNKKTGMLERAKPVILRVGQYCGTDVKAQDALHRAIGWQSPEERKVWLLDQKINERGVRLDRPFIEAANKVVDEASVPLAAEFARITGGLKMTQRDKVMEWCRGEGVHLADFRKETLAAILGEEDEEQASGQDDDPWVADQEPEHIDLPSHVHRALTIRQLIGSASVKKLRSMLACMCSDDMARGLLQYHGAGTGRWAGRLLQPQNFPRGNLDIWGKDDTAEFKVKSLVDAIMTGDHEFVEMMFGPAVAIVVASLRHALIPRKGRQFAAGDFNTIELRVNLALAQQWDKVDMMKQKGDPYIDMARLIFPHIPNLNKKDHPEERQYGKNSVLGLGFQMGAPKFRFKYAPDRDLEWCKDIVRVFRQDWAPRVPSNWYELEEAAVRCVWDRVPTEAKGCSFALENGWLTMRLPSGRKLWYRNPKPVNKAMPWDPTDVRMAWTFEAMKMGQWKTIDAYGGLLTNNAVQGMARDLMVHAMFGAEDNGFEVALTVHDEIITEPDASVSNADKVLEEIMCDIPAWARDMNIPVAAEAWAGDRYRK